MIWLRMLINSANKSQRIKNKWTNINITSKRLPKSNKKWTSNLAKFSSKKKKLNNNKHMLTTREILWIIIKRRSASELEAMYHLGCLHCSMHTRLFHNIRHIRIFHCQQHSQPLYLANHTLTPSKKADQTHPTKTYLYSRSITHKQTRLKIRTNWKK